jgi:hypothetical protein
MTEKKQWGGLSIEATVTEQTNRGAMEQWKEWSIGVLKLLEQMNLRPLEQ